MDDTSTATRNRHVDVLRTLGPVERARRAAELSIAVRQMAMAGIRRRHPEAGDHEVLMRYLSMTLGPDTVAEVYGWTAD
jgi:hypothetical protein